MQTRLIDDFVATIRSVAGDHRPLPLHTPVIGATEKRVVAECLDSTFVSSVGSFVTRFEEEVATYVGSSYAIAVSSGTVGLQVALVLAGVEHGDEVVIPSLSFIATANAVVHAGGVPVFVDSDPDTLGMSPTALAELLSGMTRTTSGLVNPATGRRIVAVVPMHTLGNPADIDAIVAVAAEYGIVVVEDAAESLGSRVGDRHTGTSGIAGVLSFNGNKIITTGGGGMIITDDPEFARRARHLTSTAKLPHAWEFEHDEVGWNYRMPNLNAALGVAQLAQLEPFLSSKRELARRYAAAFDGFDGISFVPAPVGTTSNNWLCAVRLDTPSLAVRNALLNAAAEDGVQARPLWNLLSDQRMYAGAQAGPLDVARDLVESVICLPSSSWLLDPEA